MNVNKSSILCFIITSIFAVSIFIAPFFMEKNAIEKLDGSAWKIDYRGKWDSIPLFPRLVYYFGDINCHQKYYRSYYLNGNQMAICSRDIGMLLGLSFGFFLSLSVHGGSAIKSTAIKFFRYRIKKTKKFILLFSCLFLPLIIDGFFQMYTNYESTNFIRTITGFLLGVGIASLSSILFLTDPRIDKSS